MICNMIDDPDRLPWQGLLSSEFLATLAAGMLEIFSTELLLKSRITPVNPESID
jgi:hypothetical protein